MNPKLTKVRIQLLLDEPFFGTILMGMKMIEDANLPIPTMCTNGEWIKYDPKFVDELTEAELKTVLAHECMHVAMLHPFRLGGRHPQLFNQAADHVINLELERTSNKNGRYKFPTGKYEGLKDPRFNGMSAEEVYEILFKENPPMSGGAGAGNSGGSGKGKGNGNKGQSGMGFGEFETPSNDPSKVQEAMQKAKIKVLEAASAAKDKGDLPAEVKRMIEEITNPKVDWRQLLRAFITAPSRDDYCFSRPNPRYLHTGFIMPSLYSNRLGRIAVAVDTSGSIGAKELAEFMAEVEGIIHEAKPESLNIIACDAEIHSDEEFYPGDVLPTHLQGGGGTDFAPVFKRLDKNPPVALVYLTDLCGSFPKKEPSYPVLWVCNQKGQTAPFGTVVEL